MFRYASAPATIIMLGAVSLVCAAVSAHGQSDVSDLQPISASITAPYVFAAGGIGSHDIELVASSGSTSIGVNNDETYDKLTFMVGAGVEYLPKIRFEARGIYVATSESDTSGTATATLDTSSIALMGVARYDLIEADAFTAYAGAGAGISFNQFDLGASDSANGSSSSYYRGAAGLAFGAFVGAEYAFTSQMSVFAEAGYTNFGSQTLDSYGSASLDASYSSIAAVVGFKLKF